MNRQRDDALIERLLPDFFHMQNPGAAWMHAVSAHLAIPALRALWIAGPVDYQQPECTDVSGHGHHLQTAAALGNLTFGYDANYPLVPMVNFQGGANQYLFRLDGGAGNWADVLGTENYIRASQRGLSLGGWFYWAALPGAVVYLIAKDDNGANRQYQLRLTAGNNPRFVVWPGGVGVSHTSTISVGWNHIFAIYDQPNQDLHIALNGKVVTSAGVAPAALVDTAAPLTIGADGAGANRLTGYASLCWLAACSLYQSGDFSTLSALYHFTGPMCGRQV